MLALTARKSCGPVQKGAIISRLNSAFLQTRDAAKSTTTFKEVASACRCQSLGKCTLRPIHGAPSKRNFRNTCIDLRNHQTSRKDSTHALGYQPPNAGVLSYVPTSWVPFAELMRIDKPAGTLYLFLPCLFSTLLAACYTNAPTSSVLSTSVLFLSGALIMRGAGCTVNDLWDRNLDPHVTRTRLRPIARGAVSPFAGMIFAGIQCLAGLGVLVQFPIDCLFYGIPSLLLVATYPLTKRVTHYPQFILGLTFSWGAFMGFPALNVDVLSNSAAFLAVGALYASCVSWTILYDMIYAHMDIKDDAQAGIKSIALRHDKETKAVLSGLAILQTSFLTAAGSALSLSPIFYVTSGGSAIVTLGIMIWRVKLKDPQSCWWWFQHGSWLTGGGIVSGMLAEMWLT